MPGRVITVDRRASEGWFSRTYLPAIAQGLVVTSRRFFQNLRTLLAGGRPGILVQFPEERVDYPDAFRGMPVLVQLENGQPKCVACGLCEFACPTDCITIVPGELEGDAIERYPAEFDIDMSRCMFCGLCEEACPEEAIVMSREVEISTFEREATLFHKKDLLVPEPLLKRRLDFIRSEYDRAHEPVPRRGAPEATAAPTPRPNA